MDQQDSYLFKAAELFELAKNEHYAEFNAEFESLALAYLRLAEQAKQKDYLDIDSETPLLNKMVVPNLGNSFARARPLDLIEGLP